MFEKFREAKVGYKFENNELKIKFSNFQKKYLWKKVKITFYKDIYIYK